MIIFIDPIIEELRKDLKLLFEISQGNLSAAQEDYFLQKLKEYEILQGDQK